jgi:NAD(P)-dependent dehydrogenase (short-subunit alcohol dehydrogenase family)
MILQGKTAIITGGTGGIGTAVVRAFLREGATVMMTYIKETELNYMLSEYEDLGHNDKLHSLNIDVTIDSDVRALVKETIDRCGRIDVLVNLVGGISKKANIADTEEKVWDFVMNLNVRSVFLCSKAVLKPMIEQKRGKIINVSAMAAMRPGPGRGPYATSKAAVITLTETLSEEVKDYNIQVNAIAPSVVATPANMEAVPGADYSKWVTPENVAQTVLFLASEASDAVTGTTIKIYGKV